MEERDLTRADTGTAYQVDTQGVVAVGADGLVIALADGVASITATNGALDASAMVTVLVSDGDGFLRGQVLDDATGLPLAAVTATLLEDGAGAPTAVVETVTDARGRWILPGRSGPARVRLARDGFASVERAADLPADTARTVVDARLTRIVSDGVVVRSALGGTG